MKYEEIIIDKEHDLVRITTQDERFYRKIVDGKTVWVPSVTWVAASYPKGKNFENHLLSHTKEEANSLLNEAGERGTIIHKAIEMLLLGKELRYDMEIDI